MRPNVLWRNNSHHKPSFSYPYIGTSLVGGIQGGFSIDKTSTDPSLLLHSPLIFSAKVVMHPLFLQETLSNKKIRNFIQQKQNSIPPLLHRPPRTLIPNFSIVQFSIIFL